MIGIKGLCSFALLSVSVLGAAGRLAAEAEPVIVTANPVVQASPLAAPAPVERGRKGIFGLSADVAYYTYGMNDVNNRFLNGRDGSFHGGLGYGAGLKYGFSDRFAGKLGADYLMASADSSKTVGGTRFNSRVDLPATMLLLGGEYVLLGTPVLDLKVSGALSWVSIFNGKESGTNGNDQDLGSISGSGPGGQVGAGVELFLGRGFSLETGLAYNFARIDRATFAGAPNDPNASSSNGVVDYSGLMAKAAVTIYLVP